MNRLWPILKVVSYEERVVFGYRPVDTTMVSATLYHRGGRIWRHGSITKSYFFASGFFDVILVTGRR